MNYFKEFLGGVSEFLCTGAATGVVTASSIHKDFNENVVKCVRREECLNYIYKNNQ